MNDFMNLILEPMQEVLLQFGTFMPNLLALLVIFVIGLALAWLCRALLVRLLKVVKFDSWSDRMGFTTLMRKGQLWSSPSQFMGTILFWGLILITLMAGLSALDIRAIDHLVEQFFIYLPRVLSAILVLTIGYVLAGFLSRAVLIAAVNSGLHYAKLIAEAVRILMSLLFLAMAMEQLQVAPDVVLAAFSILFGGIVAALAIAFGIGGIEAAKRVIESELVAKPEEEAKEDVEHI